MFGFCIYKPKVQTNLYKRLQFHSVETIVKNKLFIFLFPLYVYSNEHGGDEGQYQHCDMLVCQ